MYFGGRYTYLDFYLSVSRKLESGVDYLVTSRHAESVHSYMEKGWGETGWEILPFLPEAPGTAFDRNMLQVFKTALRPWVLLCRADTPLYTDLSPLLTKLRRRTCALIVRVGRSAPSVVLVEKSFLLDFLTQLLKKGTDAVQVLPSVFRQLVRHQKSEEVALDGFSPQIRNIDQYMDAHRSLLSAIQEYNDYFRRVTLHSGVSAKRQAVVERRGEVYNSMLADDCHVHGKVKNSILYPGVLVGRGCEIVDSVVLPGISLAPGVKLTKALIGEGGALSQNNKYHILDNVSIGREAASSAVDNSPLEKGYSFVSAGVVVPRGVTVGANCYLAPTVNRTRFKRVKNISDGRLLN